MTMLSCHSPNTCLLSGERSLPFGLLVFLFFFVLFENIEFNEAVLTFTQSNNFFLNIDLGYSLYK